ncbi:MAG: dockerin type I repeat-containing protein [Oscillospiraceae bacterium]|nr:dockerin type I repeat-containing protein [Oscillospiraceae bacterium]
MDFCNSFVYKSAPSTNNIVESTVDDASPVSAYDVDVRYISTPEEFLNIGTVGFPATEGTTYVLKNDLDIGEITSQGLKGKEFNGVFDGNGYTISNYKDIAKEADFRNHTAEMEIGLFPVIGENGVVKNLTVESAEINYNNSNQLTRNIEYRAGIIAGHNKGTIENCHVENSKVIQWIHRRARARVYSGGIAGENSGEIKECGFVNTTPESAGHISARVVGQASEIWAASGGIAGVTSGSIINCYANGTHAYARGDGAAFSSTTVHLYAGGISGQVLAKGSISYCYADGNETLSVGSNTIPPNFFLPDNYRGKIIGKSQGEMENCFYKNASGNKPIGNITSINGAVAVDNFRHDTVEETLRFDQEGSPWTINKNDNNPPSHKAYEKRPTFIVEHLGEKTEYYVGDILNTQMKVSFTANPNVEKPLNITNDVQIRYDFGASGKSTVYFIYTVDKDIVYIGFLEVPIRMPEIIIPIPIPIPLGYVSGGETLSVTDARLVLQHLVGKIHLSPEQLTAADVDGQDGVTISDARLILQKLVGKIDKFPADDE